MSLKRTIYSIILLFSLLPLCLFSLFMVGENNKKIEEVTHDALESISSAHLLYLSSFFETQQSTLKMISELTLVQDAVHSSLAGTLAWDDSNRAYLTNVLSEQKAYHDYIETLTIVDKNYMIVASGVEYPNYEDATELSGIDPKYLTGDFILSNAYNRNYDSGTKRVVAAYQGIYTDGELVGYIIEEIPTAYFDRFRTQSGFSANETYHILDGNLAVITAGTNTDYLEEIHSLTSDERQEFQAKWDAIDHELNPSGFISFSNSGTDYITYYSAIPCTSWGMRITTDLTARQQAAQEFQTLLFTIVTVLALIFLTLSVFLAKFITAPIDRIVSVLRKVQDDQDYSLRLPANGNNELGFLSEKVNELLGYIERENIADKLKQQYLTLEAESDPLTGIKNKKAFSAATKTMIANAVENNSAVAVGFLDIDDFREYNTIYGHQQGDAVIQFVASSLSAEVNGIVGRTGGDEFAFCIPDPENMEQLQRIAQKIRDRIHLGCAHIQTGERISVSCSIGIVCDQSSTMSYNGMMQQADEAMYRAKEKGKNCFVVCSAHSAATNE